MTPKFLLTAIASLTMVSQSLAQHQLRMPDPFASLMPFQKNELENQAASFHNAAKPAVATAAKSTVAISSLSDRVAYGTVVNTPGNTKPAILTKWSEVKNARNQLVITSPEGSRFPAKVTGVFPEHDLAVLAVTHQDAQLTPLNLTQSATPNLGSFIMLARPDGNVEGFGVVSAETRSLRDSDKAYLGVMMDFATADRDGVALNRVMPGSAADKAGLRKGDVIVSIDQTNITGAMEMRNLLQRLSPKSKIVITYHRGNVYKNTTVRLGSLSDNAYSRRIPPNRMKHMQRMGAIPSQVRSDFPSVIQSDMPIHPRDAGAPVTDLDGNIVGIAIARGSRIKTFIIPTATIRKVLKSPAQPLSVSLTRENERDQSRATRIRRDNEAPIDRVKRILGDTRRNNDENANNLRKIEEALRKLDRGDKNRR